MSAVVRLEFKLAFLEAIIQHFRHYAKGSPFYEENMFLTKEPEVVYSSHFFESNIFFNICTGQSLPETVEYTDCISTEG